MSRHTTCVVRMPLAALEPAPPAAWEAGARRCGTRASCPGPLPIGSFVWVSARQLPVLRNSERPRSEAGQRLEELRLPARKRTGGACGGGAACGAAGLCRKGAHPCRREVRQWLLKGRRSHCAIIEGFLASCCTCWGGSRARIYQASRGHTALDPYTGTGPKRAQAGLFSDAVRFCNLPSSGRRYCAAARSKICSGARQKQPQRQQNLDSCGRRQPEGRRERHALLGVHQAPRRASPPCTGERRGCPGK